MGKSRRMPAGAGLHTHHFPQGTRGKAASASHRNVAISARASGRLSPQNPAVCAIPSLPPSVFGGPQSACPRTAAYRHGSGFCRWEHSDAGQGGTASPEPGRQRPECGRRKGSRGLPSSGGEWGRAGTGAPGHSPWWGDNTSQSICYKTGDLKDFKPFLVSENSVPHPIQVFRSTVPSYTPTDLFRARKMTLFAGDSGRAVPKAEDHPIPVRGYQPLPGRQASFRSSIFRAESSQGWS